MRKALLTVGLLTSLYSAAAAEPVRALIITGETDLPYHDWRISTPFLREVLERTGRFAVKVIEEPRAIDSATLSGYDVLVLNYNGPRWGERAEAAVEQFIRSGKGMIAIHGVSYGPFYGQNLKTRQMAGEPWPAYGDLMGVNWKLENIGHSRRHVFPVKWVDSNHPVARGLAPTFLANDELYHKMDLKPGVQVLASAYSDTTMGGTGKEEPIIWTAAFGKGRIVHMTLGHDLSAMTQPGFVTAFARGAEWAATREVTLPASISVHPGPAKDAVRVLAVTGGHSYPTSFYSVFEGYPDIIWSHATSQSQAFRENLKSRFDVLVLHDMHETISDKELVNLQAFVEAGGGIVSIHHAIVDYTSWPWWYEEVIGGKYFTKAVAGHAASSYREGVEVIANPVRAMSSHPVLRGVGPIVVTDEVYKGMWHSPRISVLMETEHPENDRPVVYLGPNAKVKSVYIQLGHESETFHHPGYRQLVRNGILWAAGRLK